MEHADYTMHDFEDCLLIQSFCLYILQQIRYVWYQHMTLLEDEQAQLHGIVTVSDLSKVVGLEANMIEFVSAGHQFIASIPYKTNSCHFCYQNPRLDGFVKFLQVVFRKQLLVRFRSHCGSALENQYALLSYGIPPWPIDEKGAIKSEVFEKDLEERRKREEAAKQQELEEVKKTNMVPYPSPEDVILGRGKPFHQYPGNQRMAALISLHRDQYQRASERLEKICITTNVVKHLQETGTRFLHRTPQGWVIADNQAALDKVGRALRNKVTDVASAGKPAPMETTSAPINESKRVRYDENADIDPSDEYSFV